MKSLLQINLRKFLFIKTCWLLPIVLIATTIFTGCKRDFTPPCDNGHGKGNNSAIIVHHGGSIQAAVDAAKAGDVIQIEAGVYNEAILVDKPGIQLIGFSCNPSEKVIIQNPGDADNGIKVTDAGDGFTLKNVTVQNFKENGVILIHVDNFLLSHVTALNDGAYGLFPVFCNNGVVEYCTASGHDDTGIYVGQSDNVAMQYNIAYGNVNGLEVENCRNVVVFKNHSYDNVAGLLVILLPGLTIKTSSGVLVTENNFENNNHVNFGDPEDGFEALVPTGTGILNVGSDNVTIKNNKITNNNFTGIATVSDLVLGALAGLPPEAFADIEPNPDNSKITDNVLANNGTNPPAGLPLPGVDLLWDGSGTNNCWKDNSYTSEYPSPLPTCN
jgi:parallel beta-helix repeat protein